MMDRSTLGMLEFALEEMEDMIEYVPEYFREKWGYDKSIEHIHRHLDRARET